MTFYPGDRVKVFDANLFIDDKTTPLSFTIRPATIVCSYGRKSFINPNWKYPHLIDVRFDHRPETISHGHFADGIEKI